MNAAGLASAATDLLETGLKAYPDDPRLLAALGWVILRGDSGPQRTRELAVIEARLGPRARRSGQLDLLGRTSLERGDLEASVGYERRALAIDPTCTDCLGTMARALAAVDRYAEALAAARLGQGYQHHGGGSPALAAQIAEYDARLDVSAGERAWAQASEACAGARRAQHKVGKGAQPGGQLPAETVRGVLRGLKPALAACYDDGRTRNPALSGTVVVAFSIDADGRVTGIDTTCDTLKDRAVTSCVVDAYRGLVFPPPEGGAMPISTPVVFAP
jgi:TonB family protein